jgi:hypothetical protein
MATAIEQLEAMRRLAENWDGYGGAPPRLDVIDLAQAFVGLIEAAIRKGHTPNAKVLHVSPTRIGGALIEWEDELAEHEVECNPDGSVSFLHLNKKSQQVETRKFSPGAPAVVSAGLLSELQLLLAA